MTVDVRSLTTVGSHLHRPECVLATARELFVPDWRGGISRIAADGSVTSILARDPGFDLRPNGITLTNDGAFLLANLGDDGGIWRLEMNGRLSPFLTEVDGERLPPANFVTVDALGRTWISVSTRHVPRQHAWRPDISNGFIVLVDHRGARIVADGLHYTNEVRPDPSGRWLYTVETFGRRLIRFPLASDGALGRSEQVLTLSESGFPDGFAFDDAGGIWLTTLVSNQLLRFSGDRLTTVLADSNSAYVATVEDAFKAGTLRAEHLGPIPGCTLQQLTSLAFGGPSRRTVFLGSLHADRLYSFEAEVAGARERHWGRGHGGTIWAR